jgi:drug/metabolite transporter (DMT)-like permease
MSQATALTSAPLKGIAAMVAGAALLSMNDAASKHLAEAYPVGQVLCLRQAASLLFIVPYALYFDGRPAFRIGNGTGQAIRGLLFLATAVFMVLGLSLLPIATVTAIAFASPIFVAALSVPLLNERVGWRRWLAVLVGFAGVLVIVRPTSAAFEWALLVPVAAACANGLRDIFTRYLARTDSSISILFWSTVIVAGAAAFSAPFGWHPLTGDAVLWFLVNGAVAAGAHFLMIEALRLGEAALIAPFRYTALVWAIIYGYLLWGDLPGTWVIGGGAMVVASNIYMIRREAQRGR